MTRASWTNSPTGLYKWPRAGCKLAELGRVQFGDATIEYEVYRSGPQEDRADNDGRWPRPRGRTLGHPGLKTGGHRPKAGALDPPAGTGPSLQSTRKRFVSGETLPYLGRNVRLIVEPADVPSPDVRFDHWSFRIAVPIGLDESRRYDGIRKAIVRWYRQRAAQRLPRTVELWRKRMGWPETPGVLIRDQRQRWGSCAPDGTLRFNWRVAMVHPELAEYVIVHELAHLKVSSHSAEYWAQVSSLLPDAQQRRQRLREAGKMLPI